MDEKKATFKVAFFSSIYGRCLRLKLGCAFVLP